MDSINDNLVKDLKMANDNLKYASALLSKEQLKSVQLEIENEKLKSEVDILISALFRNHICPNTQKLVHCTHKHNSLMYCDKCWRDSICER